jgi:hypothetical protein
MCVGAVQEQQFVATAAEAAEDFEHATAAASTR